MGKWKYENETERNMGMRTEVILVRDQSCIVDAHMTGSYGLTITCMKVCLGWNHCRSRIPRGTTAIRYL